MSTANGNALPVVLSRRVTGLAVAYYPGWIWRDAAWLKNLILFFDGVALLVPEYMRHRPALADPAIVAGLEEHGLLRVLEPETFVDRPAAEHLASAFVDVIASDALETLHGDGERWELSLKTFADTVGARAGVPSKVLLLLA